MERTKWKEKQIEKLEHRCENIYIDEGLKIYILDLIEQAVSDCGTIYPHTIKEQRARFIAEVRHIGWIAYQIAAGQPYNEEINEDQLKSLLDGICFQDENPDNSPEQNHDNWVRMKISQGWKYGKTKDFAMKTHPDLLPFDALPEIERKKDIADTITHKMAVKLWDAQVLIASV